MMKYCAIVKYICMFISCYIYCTDVFLKKQTKKEKELDWLLGIFPVEVRNCLAHFDSKFTLHCMFTHIGLNLSN